MIFVSADDCSSVRSGRRFHDALLICEPLMIGAIPFGLFRIERHMDCLPIAVGRSPYRLCKTVRIARGSSSRISHPQSPYPTIYHIGPERVQWKSE
jgi:hypothetical protein